MRNLRDLILGSVLLITAACTVVGGIFLGFGEAGIALLRPTSTPTLQLRPNLLTSTPTFTLAAEAVTSRSPTLATQILIATLTPTPSFSPSPTLTNTPSATAPATATMTASPLRAIATSTLTVTPCTPPTTWIVYVVKEGETMFRIGRRYALSAAALQQSNCLPGTALFTGQRIFVPAVILTPDATETSVPTATAVPAPLTITLIELRTVSLDSTRNNGAIAFVRVVASGGVLPYAYADGDTPQAFDVYQIKTQCGETISNTAKVTSADGQVATKPYIFYNLPCPPK